MKLNAAISYLAGAASACAVLVLAGTPRPSREAESGPRSLALGSAMETHAPFPRVEPATAHAQPEPSGHFRYAPIDLDVELIEPLPQDVEVFFEDYLERDFRPELIDLGRRLFHDTRLSTDNSISCATCHDLRYAGVDRAVTPTGYRGQIGSMNTPSVFNAVFHLGQFWDGRAPDLESQVDGPPNAVGEMASSWDEISAKLCNDSELMKALGRAFPGEDFSERIDPRYVRLAIAEFERTLITPNSPFDRYLRGDTMAVSETVKEGYQVFKDVGCTECHNGMAVGGGSYQLLGRQKTYIDPGMSGVHLGRFNVTGLERDKNVFKVGSLRNIELTGPYLHDGSIDSLEGVVRMMGEYQLGLRLTDGQVLRIVAFLRSLTGEFEGRPLGSLQNTVAFPATDE